MATLTHTTTIVVWQEHGDMDAEDTPKHRKHTMQLLSVATRSVPWNVLSLWEGTNASLSLAISLYFLIIVTSFIADLPIMTNSSKTILQIHTDIMYIVVDEHEEPTDDSPSC